MEKPGELIDEEVEQSPVLQDVLERAKTSGQSLTSYHGAVFAIVAVEDITHTFTPEELRDFCFGLCCGGTTTWDSGRTLLRRTIRTST